VSSLIKHLSLTFDQGFTLLRGACSRIGAALFLVSDLVLAVQLCNNLAFPFIVHAVSGALPVVGRHQTGIVTCPSHSPCTAPLIVTKTMTRADDDEGEGK
jgi:hypothetical protein